MNASTKSSMGIIVAVALTAGMALVMGLELQRSFDPTPAEQTAVHAFRGRAAAGSGTRAGTEMAEPARC